VVERSLEIVKLVAKLIKMDCEIVKLVVKLIEMNCEIVKLSCGGGCKLCLASCNRFLIWGVGLTSHSFVELRSTKIEVGPTSLAICRLILFP
jgi:hypothetical protein